MRSTLIAAIVAAASLATASPAFAWGAGAHRYIMRRAIEMLPANIKALFEPHRDELILRVIDPDLWRTVGWDEDSNHFLDFGVREYGDYPFAALPREYDAAIEKFGMATLHKNGTLPWREAEEFGNLRRAFERLGRGNSFAIGDVVLFAAVASHYIQDAHQPLHATNNYDGNLTGQAGVHSRFETDLFERFEPQLTITPPPIAPIANPRNFAFDVLLASYKLVEPLLAADRAAVAGKDEYDDDYFAKFFEQAKPILEQRMGASISATAGLITSAWEQAGRPDLDTRVPRQAQKVRKPRAGSK